MAAINTNLQTIWEDGDVTEMARFQVDGANGVQADLTSIARNIFDLSGDTPGTSLGEDAVTIATSVFDTLQTDARWTKDLTGYNFRDRVPASKFSTGGRTYLVEYLFTGAGGEKFWIVFKHPAKKIYTS